jgi:hypothetical protein
MKWRDKWNILIIFTYQGTEMKSDTKRGKETQNPLCVIHYNMWGGWHWLGGPAAANIPCRNTAYAQTVHEIIQKTAECHSAERNDNL